MRVRFIHLSLLLLLLAAAAGFAQQKPADIVKHPACPLCGMNREMYAHSRVYIEYEDGSSDGFCSIHCAAASLAVSYDRIPTLIRVGDYDTKQLIDAETAVWVVGGSKAGVMSARAKWAFAGQASADAFIKANGGVVATFDVAMRGTYEDMYADTKMIRDRRAAKRKAAEEAKKAEAGNPAASPAKP